MKHLLICRHAKSSWEDLALDDHERPLAPRGLRDSSLMADRLIEKDIFPDLILSSNAKRAKTTAQITADHLQFPMDKIIFTPKLYHATAPSLLSEIKKTQKDVQFLFVFGHNPSCNELIWLLGGKIDNLPTCGQYGFIFEVEDWKTIDLINASTWFLDFPKNKA